MKAKYKKNMITGGVIFVFGLVYFILSWQIANFKGLGAPPIDAKFVPRLWGGMLMLLSLIVFLRGLLEYLRLKKEGKIEKKNNGTLVSRIVDAREVILTFVCLLVYIALLQPVGFIIMSALFIFAECMILTPKEKRKPLIAIIVGIVAAVVVDFAFVRLLHVLLPAGIIGF